MAVIYMIHGDICRPINLHSGSFRYYFILVDVSGSHLEVALLPTRYLVFPKLLAILLRYKTTFLSTQSNKPSSPLNFGAPETFTMNPDSPTSLTNTETTKLINLKALVKNVPDGFSTDERIIRTLSPEAGMSYLKNAHLLNHLPNGHPNNPKFILPPSL